jgi:hypothetical protein
LGNGILFLDQIEQEQTLHLKDVTAYKNGMVELWYEIRKDQEISQRTENNASP